MQCFLISIVIVPLIGLALNYTPWGIKIETILISVFIFIIIIGVVAIYRWIKTKPEERFTITFNISFLKSKVKPDRLINSILVVFIVIILILLAYAIVIPKTGEQFTDFYILGHQGIAEDYPTYLTAGENTSLILGVANHEGQTIEYTIEVWLINQTKFYNETTKKNETVYNYMWFIDKIVIILNGTPADIDKLLEPQWEYNYTFAINKTGENLKLQFLLFKDITEDYKQNENYHNIAEEKINNAYRKTHLWITVFQNKDKEYWSTYFIKK